MKMSYEDDEFSRIYEYTDVVKNTEGKVIDGVDNVALRHDYRLLCPLLAEMEALARELEFAKDSSGFTIKRDKYGKLVILEKALGKRYFYSLKAFFHQDAFNERYIYSLHVLALCEAFKALGLHPSTFTFGDPGSLEHKSGKAHGEVFNEVIAKLGEILGTSRFRERLRVRVRGAKRNQERALTIEQQVFETKSRHLVLMLHFGFQEKYRHKITLEQIQKHREKFFNNRRTNRLLRGIVDYIWTLEEGDETGLHLHVLIFYRADDVRRDVLIARLIGEYWENVVTKGEGQYWNSNADKWFHEKYGHGVGTGEINWDDHDKRKALRKNIQYMTKADQFLKMKYGEQCHVFGTSQAKAKKKAGRPRKQASDGKTVDASPSDKTLDD
ncbi:inovirus-type Gp2 protein [Caballeronia sp. LZ065]|nr:inovirus-type Gp2 protein [Caballeronia sp. LZ065]